MLDDHGPCWPDPDPSPECCPAWETADPALKTRVAAIAAFVMWSLAGRRHGVCQVTVRPCGEDCGNRAGGRYSGYGGMYPLLTDRGWINCLGGQCSDCPGPCSCCHTCAVKLVGPVQEVVEVRVDGSVVPAASYRVDDHRDLVRVDGECWPRCPDLEAPCGLVGGGGFCVTYTRGLPLDPAAEYAYEVYACELLRGCLGDSCCRLPSRITQVTRDGVTMELLDELEFLDKGLTGLTEVDQWLRLVNPGGLRQRSRVYSPDVRPARMTTWP